MARLKRDFNPVWTDEQRKAAADRMKAQWEAKRLAQSVQSPFSEGARGPEAVESRRQAAPAAVVEGQGVGVLERPVVSVEDPLTEGVAAFEEVRREIAEVVQGPAVRIGSRELVIVVRTDGTMACENTNCVCGAGRRVWHQVCLKEAEHG